MNFPNERTLSEFRRFWSTRSTTERSVKYAILTTTDSFYRYKEAVKELIAKILEENENRREGLTVQKRMLMAAQGSDSSAPEPSESAGGSYAASMQAKHWPPARLRPPF